MTHEIKIDKSYLAQQHIHFLIPCYGGMINEQTFMGFMKWTQTAKQFGINWTIETIVNESLITRGRNTLVSKFLINDTSTHLMFIDADIGWEPWHLLALIMAKKDVIGGLYPMKTVPVQWVINADENCKSENDYLQEVTKTGTGFMLIKREVLHKLKEHPAVKKFQNDIGLDKALDDHMYTFFDTAVRDGRYYSEDWTFCENFRDMGGEVWIDKRVHLRHTGSFVFCAEADMNIRERLESGKWESPLISEKQNQEQLAKKK